MSNSLKFYAYFEGSTEVIQSVSESIAHIRAEWKGFNLACTDWRKCETLDEAEEWLRKRVSELEADLDAEEQAYRRSLLAQ